MKKYILILTLISILTHIVWFTSPGVLNAGDWIFIHDEFSAKTLTNLSLWISHGGLGQSSIAVMNFPFYFAYSLLTNASITYEMAVRIIFLIPIAILTPVGMFLLAKKLLQNNLSAFIAAI